jgi:hypothetical protein
MKSEVTLLQRFWSKVDKGNGTGCWLWTGSKSGSLGYGQVRNEQGESEFAHRLAWRMANGPIPDGLYVCHTCDTPPCVRPTHLFLGTALDNTRDAVSKGRMPRMTSIADGVHSEIVSVRIAPNVAEALRKAAAERDSSVSDVIREAIKALPPAA